MYIIFHYKKSTHIWISPNASRLCSISIIIQLSSSSPVLVNDMAIYLCYHIRLCISHSAGHSVVTDFWATKKPVHKRIPT